MSEWKTVRLGDVCEIAAGQGAPQGDSNYCNDGTPFVKAGNLIELIEGKHENQIQKVSEEVAKSHKLKKYSAGSILFAKSGMSCMKGYVYQLKNDSYVVSHLAIVKPKEDSSNYIEYCLRHIKPNTLVKDEAYPSISLQDISNIQIPLPPLEEQKHIANVLDKCTVLIAKYKKMLAKYDTLIKSRFIEMFGDPVQNPMGWEVKKLGDICTKISDGVHAKPEYTATGKPFISVVNINSGKLLFDDCKYVSEEAYEKMIKSTHPEKGDVLYTKVGATYGIPALVDTDRAFCLYVSVALLKPKSEIVNSQFLTTSMAQPYIKNQADKRIKGIGVPDLHLNQIREFEVLVPPLELQNQFNSFVQQIDKSKFAVQKSLEKTETLYKSLMQEYFG